ncbi:MAG: winged helix-turn-helix domain-containing protein [Bryobacterales bacterium]|nr:winged helix-turn-helix domain-containing protein [Bryobacterales bacterium]
MAVTFGVFELDTRAAELRRSGTAVKLTAQAFTILRVLVENADHIVSREQLQQAVWGNGTHVDFDRSLNTHIAQIRAALNDDASAPRFIQTVPKQGYRFLGPVTCSDPEALAVQEAAVPSAEPRPVPHTRRRWALFAAVLATAVAGLAATLWSISRPSQPVRVAVLPFTGPAEACESLIDEAITALASNAGIQVIALRSVMRYRETTKPVSEIARELQVGYVVEGSLTVSGPDRYLLRARLIDARTESVVSSIESEGQRRDLHTRLPEQLMKHFHAEPKPLGDKCAAGWDDVRAGRYAMNKGTLDGLRQSIEFFARADCPEAWAYRAEALALLGRAGGGRERFEESAAAAERAGGHWRAVLARANASLWSDWDPVAAIEWLRRASSLQPGSAEILHDQAWAFVAAGRTEEGLASLQRAIELDPFSARINIDAGWLLLEAGAFERAVNQTKRTLELEPGSPEAAACNQLARAYRGDAEARKIVLSRDPGTIRQAYMRARFHGFAGNTEQAVASLREAREQGSAMVVLAAQDPAFRALRSDPRFRELTAPRSSSLQSGR